MFGLHPAGAQTTWDAGGDGLTWTDPLNWDTNALPQPTDATIFNLPAPTTIHLNGDQVIDSLVLQDDYSIGAFGTGKRLSLNSATTPNITVGAGVLGTVNALVSGQALNVGGTGTLYLTNLFNNPNSVNLDGATLLLNNPGGPPRLSGTGIQLNNRSDALVLGPGAKTITMTNGGGVKIIGSGYNPDGTTKAFVFGTGGGVINVASGFQQFSLDDPAQVSGTGNVTREGGGRLTITSQDYNLAGNLILNGGVTEWGRLLAGGAAGTRFSAFSTASTVTVNGGMLVPNSGTAGVIDQAITLSTGGVLGMQGQDHQYGVTAGAGTPLTLNGGTILTRDSFTPQTQRFIRIDSLLQGSGTVDLVGSTNAGGAPRVVFQRGDLAHTFDGTFRLVGNTTLETNPRHSANIGNALGSATLELSGFNSGLDMRDNGAASGAVMNYTGNDINVNSPELGGIQRLVVNQNVAGSTGNTFSFGNLSIGNNNWFQISGANGYQTRFGTLNLAPGGTSRLDVISAPTTITNAVANPGSNLIRWASNTGTASNLVFESPVSLAGLDIRHGNVTLANNATLATQRLTINAGGNNNLTTGSLVLDNTAANLTDRLPDALPIAMRGGALTLIAGGAAPASETTGNLSVPFGNPLFTATSSATQPATLTLGAAPPVQGPTAVGAFSGRNLGLGGATDSSILLPGIPPLPFLGGGVIAGGGATPPAYPNEWAKYGAAGVTPFVAADYVINSAEPAWLPAEHIKQTGVAAVTLTGARNVATLNLQPTGAGLSIATNGNLLTVEQGGILTSANAASITGTAAGGLTAGTGGAANLYVNNAAQLDINAIIQNNGAGAVTLVKSSPGVLRLTNQNPAAPHTNTHTGGTVVNNGTLEPWRLGYLGSGPVTLAGGRLNLNIPGFASNTVLAGGGQDVIVEANSFLDADNNGETGGNGSNNTASFGSLAIRGHNLGFGGFDNYDVHFANGAIVDPGSSITMIGGRDANSNIIVNGFTSGPGLLIASPSGGGGNPQNQFGSGGLTLGGGSGDLTPNTLGAVDGINVNAGTLRLNKANGINAVGGDLTINGGNVFFGPPQAATAVGGKLNFAGWGLLDGVMASGQNQIPDNATVTMYAGIFGENNRVSNERIGALVMRNGTLNPGLGTLSIGTAVISGGNVAFNSASTLAADTLRLEGGAPDLNLANNALDQATVVEVGQGGLTLTGQAISLATGGGNLAGAGGILRLGGPLNVNSDPLNAGSYTRGIFVQVGQNFRENGNSRVELLGGAQTMTIDEESFFTISAPVVGGGGITKAGAGVLALQNFRPNTYGGAVTVNDGTLIARSSTALGTTPGTTTTTVNAGGTLKLEDAQTIANEDFVLNGAGAKIPGSDVSPGVNVKEQGALVSEAGTNRITGNVSLGSSATIASNAPQVPSVSPSPLSTSHLTLASPAGVTGTGTLTLSGFGDGTIEGGVNVSGGLIKNGGGTWTINGAGSFAGPGSIEAGTLNIRNATALGAANTTTVYDGATLEVQGGISVPENLQLNGTGVGGLNGSVLSVAGANRLTGTLTLATNTTIRAGAGTLDLAGPAINGVDTTLTLGGAGNGSVSAAINLGLGGLVKAGTGSWTLSGANFFTGATSINGGALVLDTTAPGTRLSPAAPINFGGGSLRLIGAGSQTVNGLNLLAGGALIDPGTLLNGGAISRSVGATANVVGAGTLAATAALTNGILPYATVNGSDFATIVAGNVVANAAYTPLSHSAVADTNNSMVTVSHNQSGGSVSTNSLKIGGTSGGAALGANSLTLASSGLLYAGTSNAGISGSGIVSGATANDELIVHTSGGSLDIAAPIIGAGSGSLTKAGTGTLVLSGNNAYTGSVFINGGTLAIPGPGGTTHPGGLGALTGQRSIVVNGGTFSIPAGDYDPSPVAGNQMNLVIGSAGGTLDIGSGTYLLNDTGQFAGTGDLTKTGGGRLQIGLGAANFAFDGNTNVTGGVLELQGNGGGLGGRPQNLIAMQPGTALIINSGTVANNLAMTGAELYARGGDRTYAGNISLSGGANTIALVERDAPNQNRSLTLSGRVSMDANSSLNVVGSNAGSVLFLSSGSNQILGDVNLMTNASMELRQPGSLRDDTGFTNVNLNGVNSRLLLRHYQNGSYNANVNVNSPLVELSADRLANNAAGSWQYLSVNDLQVNQPSIINVAGANNYSVRVAGRAAFTGSQIINAPGAHMAFQNGLSMTPGATLDKRHNGFLQITGPANPTTLLIQGPPTGGIGGGVDLRGAGALVGTTGVILRGGELRVDNSDGVIADRVPDGAAITLNGGALRSTGPEIFGPISATGGETIISFTPVSRTVTEALTLTNWTRSTGSHINFTSEFGTLGATNGSNVSVTPRIIIPGQADTPGTEIIPWARATNNEFVQYSSALDGGQPRGVIQLNNNAVAGYNNDPAEGAFAANIIARMTGTATTTLTANRAIRAIKMDGGTTRTIDVGAFALTVDQANIIHVANNQRITGTAAGILRSGTNQREFFFNVNGGNLRITPQITDNIDGQATALVKSGGGVLTLDETAANSFTGGVYINGGTLDVWRANRLGSNTITLQGGQLSLNIPVVPAANDVNIPVGNNIVVEGPSFLGADNNGETAGSGLDNNLLLGNLAINGPYTLTVGGFDSYDFRFENGASFSGTPVLDLGAGRDAASTTTINGAVTGSGFILAAGGGGAGTLELGGGAADAVANTYTGTTTVIGSTLALNKANGTNAVTGDLVVNGGTARLNQPNQIVDSANLTVNAGTFTFNNQAETIASVTQNGGLVATGTSTARVTGDYLITGISGTDGLQVNSGGNVTIDGNLDVGTHGKAVVGANGGSLSVGSLDLSGSTVQLNGDANAGTTATLNLNGNVNTSPASISARIEGTDDSNRINLNGARTFNVSQNAAGDGDWPDLIVNGVLADGTAASSLIKMGPGTMSLGGAGASTFTGSATVAAGTLELNKPAGTTAIPGALSVSSGATLRVRSSNQIADSAAVTLNSSAVLDLESHNTSDRVGSISGALGAVITVGPGSILTTGDASNTSYAGTINGAGGVVKEGSGRWTLTGTSDYAAATGVNAGILEVNGVLRGTPVIVNAGARLAGIGTISVDRNGLEPAVTVGAGGTIAPGASPGILTTGTILGAGGTFEFELNGTTAGSGYDQIQVTGLWNLGASSTLNVLLGFAPTLGDTFFIGLNDNTDPVSGTFAGLAEGSVFPVGSSFFSITYAGNGDAGATGNDIQLTAVVPEPGSALLLGLGMAGFLARRRRRS